MSISGGKTNRPVAGTTERKDEETFLGDQIIARSGRPGMEALVPRSLTDPRLFVYVATPLRGQYPNCEDEISLNYERADVILRTIARNYAQVVPLSPLHAFRFMSVNGSQDRAMDLCGELLSLCSELWLFGDWRKSEGCSEERSLAMARGLDVYEFPAPQLYYCNREGTTAWAWTPCQARFEFKCSGCPYWSEENDGKDCLWYEDTWRMFVRDRSYTGHREVV